MGREGSRTIADTKVCFSLKVRFSAKVRSGHFLEKGGSGSLKLASPEIRPLWVAESGHTIHHHPHLPVLAPTPSVSQAPALPLPKVTPPSVYLKQGLFHLLQMAWGGHLYATVC